MKINTLIGRSPFQIKAIHPTGICKKGEKCFHPKNDECVSHYQSEESATFARRRFEAHGFEVQIITN